MQLPSWTPGLLLGAGFAHVTQFFLCEEALFATSDNVFGVIADIVSFTGCTDIPGWASFLLFMVFSLPLFLLVANFIFEMFGSEIGAAVAIVLGVATAAVGFFS